VGGQVAEQTRYVTSTLDALLKWPVIVAQTAIVGGAFAHLLLWRPFLRKKDHDMHHEDTLFSSKRLIFIILASSVAIAGFGTALLFVQASNLATPDNSDYLAIFQSLISGSPSGSVWMLRIATSAAIIAVSIGYYIAARRKAHHLRSAPFLFVVLVAGSVSVSSNSMLSHNSASPVLPEVAIFSDWLHFMAVSVWVGGLFYLSAVAMEMIKASSKDTVQRHRRLSLVLPKFSILATISLGIIGITGIYMAWIHIHDFNFLFETAYGNSLIVKLSAAVPMIALGGYHQLILHKNMVMLASGRQQQVTVDNNDNVRKNGGNEHDAASRFGKTVKIESFIGIGVLLAASFLTITSPPSQQHHQAVGSAMGLETVTIDNTDVTIGISPLQVGVNTFTVTLRNEEGQDPTNIQNVFMRFTNTEAGIGPIIATLEKIDGGSYSATGAYLSQPGTWEIDFIAQRTGAYDLNHSFEETLTAALTSNGETHSDHEQPSGDDIPANSMNAQVTAIPPSESFTLAAIILSIGIEGASAYSVIRSRQQLGRTIKFLIG
jgi:putative copper export protein